MSIKLAKHTDFIHILLIMITEFKMLGAGLSCSGLSGVGQGIGPLLSSLAEAMANNPTFKEEVYRTVSIRRYHNRNKTRNVIKMHMLSDCAVEGCAKLLRCNYVFERNGNTVDISGNCIGCAEHAHLHNVTHRRFHLFDLSESVKQAVFHDGHTCGVKGCREPVSCVYVYTLDEMGRIHGTKTLLCCSEHNSRHDTY